MITPPEIGLPDHFSKFYRHQLEIAQRLAFSDKRFRILLGPPGSGKTLIYNTLISLLSERALILIPTKSLQDQHYNDFSSIGLVDIRGHNNYTCAKYSSIEGEDELQCKGKCYYREKVEEAKKADRVSTNPSHWMALANSDPGRLGEFKVLVIDEGHLLHDNVNGMIGLKVSERLADSLDLTLPSNPLSIPSWVKWAREAIKKAGKKIDLAMSRDDNKTVNRMVRLQGSLRFFIEAQDVSEWRVREVGQGQNRDRDRGRRGISKQGPTYELLPVWSTPFIESKIFRGIEQIVIVSGTITPKTAEMLGIDKKEMDYIEMPSSFPAERRPVFYIPTCGVKWNMSEGHKTLLYSRIKKAIDYRLDRKGLFHTISYDWTRETVRRLKDYKSILHWHYEADRKQLALEGYDKSDPPALLVSPGFQEGLDLKEDRGRYQIVLKVPWLDRRDVITASRMSDDPEYEVHTISIKMIQMIGRIMRLTHDWGETLIFDHLWGEVFIGSGFFPKYIRDSFVRSEVVPQALKVPRVLRRGKGHLE